VPEKRPRRPRSQAEDVLYDRTRCWRVARVRGGV
jgi:hypothetical protein